MPAQFVIPSVFTAIDKFSAPVRAMANATSDFAAQSRAGLATTERGFRKLMAPVDALNNKLRGLGVFIGLYTLFRVIKGGIDVIANFQQANVDLAVVMGTTAKQNKVLADEARRIGLNYGESATDVVKMQHALATLGFERPDILQMGKPLITGSSALEGANPERLAETVGALINSFDSLASKDTQHILDVMALSANRTALNFEKLATTLPIVAAPANAVNISFEETVALLGVLSNAGVHVATSATSLKNILADSSKKGHTYNQVLENIAKNSDKLTYANKKFGKRSMVSALVLASKLGDGKNGVASLTKEFQNAKLGLTNDIAAQRLDTLTGSVKLLSAAWQEFILSMEDGTGPFALQIQNSIKVARAMLLLSSNSDQAREALKSVSPEAIRLAQNYLTVLKVVKWIVIALVAAKVALWAWNAVVAVTTIVMGAYNIALGVMGALTGVASIAIGQSGIALAAYNATLGLTTAATWLWTAALNAVPIIAIATGVLLLIGYLKQVYDLLTANAGAVDKAFGESAWEGIKKLGESIYYSIMAPIVEAINAIEGFFIKLIPSWGKGFDNLKAGFTAIHAVHEMDTRRVASQWGLKSLDDVKKEKEGVAEKINPELQRQESFNEYVTNRNQQVTVDFVNVPTGTQISGLNGKSITPVLGSTMEGSFGNKK